MIKFSLQNIFFTRLGSDGDTVYLYYTAENSRVYHKEELKRLEIPTEVEAFISKYIHSDNGTYLTFNFIPFSTQTPSSFWSIRILTLWP